MFLINPLHLFIIIFVAFFIWRFVAYKVYKVGIKPKHWLIFIISFIAFGWYSIKYWQAIPAIKAFEAAKNYTVGGIKNPFGIDKLLYSAEIRTKHDGWGEDRGQHQDFMNCRVNVFRISDEIVEKIKKSNGEYLNNISRVALSEQIEIKKEFSKSDLDEALIFYEKIKYLDWRPWSYLKYNLYKNNMTKQYVEKTYYITDKCFNIWKSEIIVYGSDVDRINYHENEIDYINVNFPLFLYKKNKYYGVYSDPKTLAIDESGVLNMRYHAFGGDSYSAISALLNKNILILFYR